eukprot:9796802-Alexandrium_andersonii.AAC.1
MHRRSRPVQRPGGGGQGTPDKRPPLRGRANGGPPPGTRTGRPPWPSATRPGYGPEPGRFSPSKCTGQQGAP